jgi:hypothetical protein
LVNTRADEKGEGRYLKKGSRQRNLKARKEQGHREKKRKRGAEDNRGERETFFFCAFIKGESHSL